LKALLRLIVPRLAWLYITFVGMTSRIRVIGEERRSALRREEKRFIYAFWHARQVFFTYSHRRDRVAVLVSKSADGELIARTMALFGIKACRGSSSRQAVAGAKAMVTALRDGFDLGITPDGPRGPAGVVKAGLPALARTLQVPILPITNALSRKIVFKKSWDRYEVPLPFGQVVVGYGKPITVEPGDDLDSKAEEIARALDRLDAQARADLEA
jgi:lysophospholipid acyltransferase (LPLAT)-like uncharacterized protein